jgi:hypothetical protein
MMIGARDDPGERAPSSVPVSSSLLVLLLLLGPLPSAEARAESDLVRHDAGGPGLHYTPRDQRREIQLLVRAEPGADLDSKKLVVLEKIGKRPGELVSVPDMHAANKWLCEAAGGTLDDEYHCSSPRVFRFEDKESLHNLRAHREAMRSVFRTPGVRSISGPRGICPHTFVPGERGSI